MRPLLPFLLLVACAGEPETSPYEPSTLEAAVVQVGSEVDFEAGNRRDFVGDLSVQGTDRDWLVTVGTSTGPHDIDVYTPSGADLSLLDGLVDVRVTIERDPGSSELSLGLSDADGVAYLIEPAEPGLLTRDLMGAGLIGRGEPLGEVQVQAWDLSLSAGLLRTDTGDVELLPGTPQAVTIDGKTYRAVLLASYEADLLLDGDVVCTGAKERLAFELLRTEDPDLGPLVRPEGQALPTSTCVAP